MQTNHATEGEILEMAPSLQRLRTALQGVLLGQETVVERVLVGMLARGHVLLEGLPGLGKTELVKAISKAVGLESRRIQFTPDLLPGDVTGSPVLVEEGGTRKLVFQPGPVFAQLVLGDEINRASPKTQSALLEAMQERQVTVMGQTRPLPEPFFVLATQNPIELEGTYPLPEAQLDRFLFKVEVAGNSVAVLERIVLEREIGVSLEVEPVLSSARFQEATQLARRIFLPKVVANYIARIVAATQSGPEGPGADLKFGASPRAVLALAAGARARALLEGRMNAGFEDVQTLALPVLGHRVILDYRARVAGKTAASVVSQILAEISPDGAQMPATLRDAKL
jgi:MoxR-like ATPase